MGFMVIDLVVVGGVVGVVIKRCGIVARSKR